MSGTLGLGRSKSSSSASVKPLVMDTGFSNLSKIGKNKYRLNFDPLVRETQTQGLDQLGGLKPMLGESLSNYQSRVGDVRSRFLGNEGSLMQALVDPTLRQNAANIGATERAVGLRGLGGSSFGMQSINQARNDAARSETNARAQATAQILQTEMGLNDHEMNAVSQYAQQLASITGMELDAAMQMAALELQKFGIGKSSSESGVNRGLQFTGKADAFSNPIAGTTGLFG